MKHILALAALALPLAAATQVAAHATFAEGEVVQGQTARLTLRVPHGCGDEATLRVRIQIPEGLIAAQPMVKAGWELETVTGVYENSYELWGNTVTEGVREIIWSGELPDAFYDEFVFRARVTDRVPAGEMLYIPAIQECANGAERWIEIPAAGQDSHDLSDPAPGVMVLAPGHSGHAH
jgi:periplasmic copper chaperone A